MPWVPPVSPRGNTVGRGGGSNEARQACVEVS